MARTNLVALENELGQAIESDLASLDAHTDEFKQTLAGVTETQQFLFGANVEAEANEFQVRLDALYQLNGKLYAERDRLNTEIAKTEIVIKAYEASLHVILPPKPEEPVSDRADGGANIVMKHENIQAGTV